MYQDVPTVFLFLLSGSRTNLEIYNYQFFSFHNCLSSLFSALEPSASVVLVTAPPNSKPKVTFAIGLWSFTPVNVTIPSTSSSNHSTTTISAVDRDTFVSAELFYLRLSLIGHFLRDIRFFDVSRLPSLWSS